MEEGEGAVWILVHADGGLDVVRSGRAGGDLEDPSFVAHGVVVSDHTLFLTTEDVIGLLGRDEGDEGTVLELGLGGGSGDCGRAGSSLR